MWKRGTDRNGKAQIHEVLSKLQEDMTNQKKLNAKMEQRLDRHDDFRTKQEKMNAFVIRKFDILEEQLAGKIIYKRNDEFDRS